LHALEPGKVCAIGSFGEHCRAWCAILQHRDGASQVHVFHQATRLPQDFNSEEAEHEAEVAFQPCWTHEYCGGDHGPRTLLVGREGANLRVKTQPLSINLDRLEVSVFPLTLGWAENHHSQSYFSRQGQLLEANEFYVMHYAQPGGALPDGRAQRELCENETHTGLVDKYLLPYRGWIYVPGGRWYRLHPETFEPEELVPGRLPGEYEGLNYGVSAHYGLVAWGNRGSGESKFYRVTVADGELAPNSPTPASPQE